jgi:hypothetical protein
MGSAKPGEEALSAMYAQSTTITPNQLATTGRALYGERWQTTLALDLQVADRTLRRWLAGEIAIPGNIEIELRELLIKRINQMGGIVGYSVHPTDQTVFHYPTAACFRYDDNGNLTLLNPLMVSPEVVPLLMQGAQETLRQERERNQRGVKGTWADPQTGRFSSSEIEREYKGCVITYPRTPMFSGKWTVNLASNNPHLLTKLGGCVVIDSHISLDDAIAKAERRVDEL